MKIQVKETLARRRTVFVLALAQPSSAYALSPSPAPRITPGPKAKSSLPLGIASQRREMAAFQQMMESTLRLK